MKRLILVLLCALPFAASADLAEPLPAQLAFRPELAHVDAHTLVVTFRIPPGYFLYRKRLALDASGFDVRQVSVLGTQQISDPVLGVEEVLDAASQIVLRGSDTAPGGDVLVKLRMQGCLKDKLCYPPEVRVLTVQK